MEKELVAVAMPACTNRLRPRVAAVRHVKSQSALNEIRSESVAPALR